MQGARLGALVLQRAGQQFVDRIGSLAPQAFQQALATAFWAEYGGEEIERRGVVSAREPGCETLVCGGELQIFACATVQLAPQPAGAVPGQPEQRFLVEPDQRRFQEACQIEIVLRQQHEAGEGQQILDRQFAAEVEPVDARHFDLLALQRFHQSDDEGIAPAHQHHEVSGIQQLAGARAPLVADQALRMQRDHSGQPLMWRQQGARVGIEIGGIGFTPGATHQRP